MFQDLLDSISKPLEEILLDLQKTLSSVQQALDTLTDATNVLMSKAILFEKIIYLLAGVTILNTILIIIICVKVFSISNKIKNKKIK